MPSCSSIRGISPLGATSLILRAFERCPAPVVFVSFGRTGRPGQALRSDPQHHLPRPDRVLALTRGANVRRRASSSQLPRTASTPNKVMEAFATGFRSCAPGRARRYLGEQARRWVLEDPGRDLSRALRELTREDIATFTACVPTWERAARLREALRACSRSQTRAGGSRAPDSEPAGQAAPSPAHSISSFPTVVLAGGRHHEHSARRNAIATPGAPTVASILRGWAQPREERRSARTRGRHALVVGTGGEYVGRSEEATVRGPTRSERGAEVAGRLPALTEQEREERGAHPHASRANAGRERQREPHPHHDPRHLTRWRVRTGEAGTPGTGPRRSGRRGPAWPSTRG